MENIETLVFDYGGVIVNVDDREVAKVMTSLGISRIKQILYARKIKRLMRQFIDGVIPTDQTLDEILRHCREDVTKAQLLKVLNELCGDLPVSRLETLVQLRKRYKVYLLSNICDVLWENSVRQIRALGYQPEDCFDECFLSYEMGVAKPDNRIYEMLIAKTGLTPSTTVYFDDRKDNYKAGKKLGFHSVFVKTNHMEQSKEWQQLTR